MNFLKLLEYLKDYKQYLPIILTIIGILTGNQGWENLNIIRSAEAPPDISAYGNVAGHGLVTFALLSSALAMSRRRSALVATGNTPSQDVTNLNLSDVEFCDIQRKLYHVFSEDPPARNACLNLWQRFYALNFGPQKPKPPPAPTPPPSPEVPPVVSHLQAILNEFQRLSVQPAKEGKNEPARPAPSPAPPSAAV